LQDYPYLTNIIEDIEAEMKEREDLEAMIIQKRKANTQ
jgi:ubiquinol-cytochrome c reductase subunit 7